MASSGFMPVRMLSNVEPGLKAGWHPVALSAEVTDAPIQVWLLGEAWVLARLGPRIVAFEDRCPHRRAPLSAGRVDGDRLRCGYHGWCFDPDGAAVEIPALGPNARLPPRARATPPVGIDERYGMVWLAPEQPAAPIIELPEASDPGFAVGVLQPTRAAVGAGLMIDNFLDFAHFPFVHSGTFGGDSPEFIRDYSAQRVPGGFLVEYEDSFTNREDPAVAKGLRPLVQTWKMTYRYRVPFRCRQRSCLLRPARDDRTMSPIHGPSSKRPGWQ
jgi:vanillate O-demethylase monooxygenase subunit